MNEAQRELARRKSYFPFREWFAVELNGEWQYFDSLRKLKSAMRKSGVLSAQILAAQ